ncbi:MAG: TolC family protein [Deltaproteobacteria bacterium]|nr:TolC family protein [Deltaproteobacteria bacterium]
MSKKHSITGFAVVLALLATVTAHAQGTLGEKTVRSSEAVRLAAQHNAALRAVLLEQDRAATEVSAVQGLYPFVLEVDGGYTHASSPSATANDGITHRSSDQVALGSQLSKTWTVGTTAALRVDGDRQVSGGSAAGGVDTGTSDPTYGAAARLSLTQPLLRGAGATVGEASLRQALNAQEIARCGARRTSSELVRDVLTTYWELWYAQRALEIDVKARDVARAQVAETEAKVEKGAVAPVDVLPFETRLATLEETVVAAAAESRRLSVQLATRTGLVRDALRVMPDLSEAPPVPENEPPFDQTFAAALTDAPNIRVSAAQVVAAEDKARTAGEEMRQRLDLVGWVEAQTLGDGEVSPAFEQFGEGAAYSGYVGLIYELPLDNTRKDAERAASNLDVEIARQNLVAASDQVRSDVATALESLVSARERMALAEQTLGIAKQQAAAEHERLDLGASIFVQVRDAEEAVRQAELRVTRARVDLVEAQIGLDHLTGGLLAVPGEAS